MNPADIVFPVTDASIVDGDQGVLFALPSVRDGNVESGYMVTRPIVELFRLADGLTSFQSILERAQSRFQLDRETASKILLHLERLNVIYGVPPHLLAEQEPQPTRLPSEFKGVPKRVAFVLPPTSIRGVLTGRKDHNLANSAPPLGILSIASVLESRGYEVLVLDLSQRFDGWQSFHEFIEDWNPGCVDALESSVVWKGDSADLENESSWSIPGCWGCTPECGPGRDAQCRIGRCHRGRRGIAASRTTRWRDQRGRHPPLNRTRHERTTRDFSSRRRKSRPPSSPGPTSG